MQIKNILQVKRLRRIHREEKRNVFPVSFCGYYLCYFIKWEQDCLLRKKDKWKEKVCKLCKSAG